MDSFNAFTEKYRLNLTAEQIAAVKNTEGAVLLLATPGSGKTTVLVSRLGYMINVIGIPESAILTMTYTVAATRDMSQRYREIFYDCDTAPEFRTINGVAWKINSYFEKAYSRSQPALISEDGERGKIIADICTELEYEYPDEATLSEISQYITYIKNMMLTSEEISEISADDYKMSQIYPAYCEKLKRLGKMDYDDQLIFAYKILNNFPDVRRHFANKFRYICVDEAQDTSRIQHEIIRLLSQDNGNIFMVGDEDQSIYGFRAAYPKALLSFAEIYKNAKVMMIQENFRSYSEIVAPAQKFIEQNTDRYQKKMISVKGEGGKVNEIPITDRSEQFSYLCDIAKNARDKKIAVLYRDNFTAVALINMLLKNNIPYNGGQNDGLFFSHKTVRDIVNIIKFAYDSTNPELFYRIYYKIGSYAPKEAVKRAVLLSQKSGDTILHSLTLPECHVTDKVRAHCDKLDKAISRFTKLSGRSAVSYIMDNLGYRKTLARRHGDDRQIAILQILSEDLATPYELVERLTELKNKMQNHTDNSDCNFYLSTIHSAKGLEYDTVYIADVFDGIFPTEPVPDSPKEHVTLEEERRLFYVAITRAKNELNIFTFKNPLQKSTFTDCFFGKATADKKKKEFSIWAKKPEKSKPQKPSKQQLEKYVVGVSLRHKVFGNGIITQRRDEIVTVEFEAHGVKKLALSAAVMSGNLKIKTE